MIHCIAYSIKNIFINFFYPCSRSIAGYKQAAYKLYKLAAGKTAKSILISCGARLAPFDIQELRDLTMYDELAVLDGGKCILQLRGVRPFLSDKYDLTQHPNYKLTSDYDPKNTFDIEKYLNRKEKINPNDEFVVIDADSLPPA